MLSDQVFTTVSQIRAQMVPVDLRVRETLLRNLVFTYHYMKASEHLLRVAAHEARNRDDLYHYFADHLDEERGHHLWLEKDLATAGLNMKIDPIPQLAMEMVGTQYYLIHHVDPAGLLGYMAVLEGFPAPMALVGELEALHGKDLLRTVRYHAEHDVDHRADLVRVIDEANSISAGVIWQSAFRTAQYLAAAAPSFVVNQNG